MRCIETMNQVLCNAINSKLIDYIMRFPFPYIDILREQISVCEITNEWYSDCYIIHFHRKGNTRQLPQWLPTAPQGCQVIKEGGPISCQLYVESGYIVQFEVVDMGMNEIDWDYLWSHKPIFEVEYDFPTICSYLAAGSIRISKIHIGQQYVYLAVDTTARSHTICLWDCNILSPGLLYSEHYCRIDICVSKKNNHRYLVKLDDNPVLECSLVCLQDGLTIG